MGATTLAIIGPPEALSQPLVQQTLDLWAQAGERPRIATLTPGQLWEDAGCLSGVRVAWFLAEGLEPGAIRHTLDVLQERHRPTLLTQATGVAAAGAAEGVAVCPPTADAATALGMLRVCWAQAGAVGALAREVQMLQIQHRGLCEQIDKIDQELRLASQMQREFLPAQLPRLHGVDFAALFRPATYVSGDIYDIVPLDGRHVAFFMADAVGHGVPAAMMTVFIAQCLRTMALNWPATGLPAAELPGAAMAELNQQMIRQQSSKVRTATACFGVIDCQPDAAGRRALWFARAGHPSAIVLRRNDESSALKPDGSLLGVFDDGQFAVERVLLSPGERLLVHSDGFEIAFRGLPASASRERIANPDYACEFASLVEGGVDEALKRLAETLDQQVGSLNQLDDLTAILIGVDSIPAAAPAAAQAAVVR